MTEPKTLDDAKEQALAARARLLGTVEDLQSAASPSRLIDEAIGTVRQRSADLVRSAGDTARARPRTVASVALAGVLLMARRPLWRLGKRIVGKD